MDKNIEILSNELSAMESNLWQYVVALDNHMDDCQCQLNQNDKRVIERFIRR